MGYRLLREGEPLDATPIHTCDHCGAVCDEPPVNAINRIRGPKMTYCSTACYTVCRDALIAAATTERAAAEVEQALLSDD